MAALLPSLLMLWSYTTATGLTVFTELVDLTVVTVAILYLFSACAQLTYLVSQRRQVHGWLLARDLVISAAAVLFSMWVTFAPATRTVYEAMVCPGSASSCTPSSRPAARPGRTADGLRRCGRRRCRA